MSVKRQITKKVKSLVGKFPVLVVTGPRQSGKTTLIKTIFPSLPYISLEDLDIRQVCENDPRSFLQSYPDGVILDEVQQVPSLFSYIQTSVDNEPNKQYVLSGSQNFLLLEKVSQTLAGRAGIFKLLPFSYQELTQTNHPTLNSIEEILFTGCYPRIFDKDIPPQDYYPNYIQTYIERDVRQLVNIGNLSQFGTFVKLCAGRIGSTLNIASLANDAGISPSTAKSWLSVLEASYVLFSLNTHHKNYNKRLVKQPKLYFYDTGLACSLLGLKTSEQVATHFLKGGLFENFIIVELLKHRFNNGEPSNLYFWRDNKGKEIDCIIEENDRLRAIEIKSGKTYSESFFDNLKYWQKISGDSPRLSTTVFGGNINGDLPFGNLRGWQSFMNELD